jgi:hypothetical protein
LSDQTITHLNRVLARTLDRDEVSDLERVVAWWDAPDQHTGIAYYDGWYSHITVVRDADGDNSTVPTVRDAPESVLDGALSDAGWETAGRWATYGLYAVAQVRHATHEVPQDGSEKSLTERARAALRAVGLTVDGVATTPQDDISVSVSVCPCTSAAARSCSSAAYRRGRGVRRRG